MCVCVCVCVCVRVRVRVCTGMALTVTPKPDGKFEWGAGVALTPLADPPDPKQRWRLHLDGHLQVRNRTAQLPWERAQLA